MSVPRLFKLYQEALTERQERENEKKKMKGLQHFINHQMFFLFLFNTFSLFFQSASQFSLHSLFYISLSSSIPLLSLSLCVLFSTFLPPFLFLVCLDLFFSPAACQQVLTWLCSIEARVLSAWPLGPISTCQLVSAQRSTRASVTCQVCLCGREARVTSFRDVRGGIYIFSSFSCRSSAV